MAGVAVENKILVARNFAVRARQKSRRVNLQRGCRSVKLDNQIVFVERDFLSLAELHRFTPDFCRDNKP